MPVNRPPYLLAACLCASLTLPPLPLALAATPAFDLAPEDGDQPPSPLVERMQEILSRLGYFKGPADGVMSNAFIEAIRAYQKAYDLPVTGRLSPDLQQHIENFGLPYGLMNRLDEARADNREAARKALAAQPETRDLLAALPPSSQVADPARNLDDCMQTPSIACLVREAGESAKAVNRPEYRQWVLRDVMKAQTLAGLLPEARQTIRRLGDPRYIIVALREQAETLALAGQPAAAEQLAATIPNLKARLRALAGIAPTLDADKAALRRLIDRLVGELPLLEPRFDAIGIASDLAQALNARGMKDSAVRLLDSAEGLVKDINGPDLRRKADYMLLESRARTGSTSALARLKSELSNAPRAHRYQAVLLSSYARLQLDSDRQLAAKALENAIELLPRISEGYAADFAAAKIATAMVALGNGRAGLDKALALEKDDLRIRTLWRIAELLADGLSGVPSGDELRAMAAQQAREVPNDFERANLLSQISLWYLERGEIDPAWKSFSDAMGAAGGMESPWWRARAFARMAFVLARLKAVAED